MTNMQLHNIKRIECVMAPTFYAWINGDADEARAKRVVSKWGDRRLFPGAVYRVVHTNGDSRSVGWNDIALFFDLKPRREHEKRPAKPVQVVKSVAPALAAVAVAPLPAAPVQAPAPRQLERLVMRRGQMIAVTYEAREAA